MDKDKKNERDDSLKVSDISVGLSLTAIVVSLVSVGSDYILPGQWIPTNFAFFGVVSLLVIASTFVLGVYLSMVWRMEAEIRKPVFGSLGIIAVIALLIIFGANGELDNYMFWANTNPILERVDHYDVGEYGLFRFYLDEVFLSDSIGEASFNGEKHTFENDEVNSLFFPFDKEAQHGEPGFDAKLEAVQKPVSFVAKLDDSTGVIGWYGGPSLTPHVSGPPTDTTYFDIASGEALSGWEVKRAKILYELLYSEHHSLKLRGIGFYFPKQGMYQGMVVDTSRVDGPFPVGLPVEANKTHSSFFKELSDKYGVWPKEKIIWIEAEESFYPSPDDWEEL